MRRERKKLTLTSFALLLAASFVAGRSVFAQQANASSNADITVAKAWAFPQFPPSPGPHARKADPQQLVHVPGSTRAYTRGQLDVDHFVPDWFPQDHAPAPTIVMEDHHEGWPWPCAECHLANGQGVPATASLAGLPQAYIIEQITAFRLGERGAGLPKTTQNMANEARALNDADLQLAAQYFSKLPYASRIRVVETATVPKTHWRFFVLVPKSGAREPIGERIIETPTDFKAYSASDARVDYVAYVPPGSIARGALIASRGDASTPACESCHGAKLGGSDVIPPLAGRSPTYLMRELILFRTGQRSNPQASPMVQVASHLSVHDMIAVAAYAASRK